MADQPSKRGRNGTPRTNSNQRGQKRRNPTSANSKGAGRRLSHKTKFDRYIVLAREASSSGDEIKAENFYQHAEHYFRMLAADEAAQQPSANDCDTSVCRER